MIESFLFDFAEGFYFKALFILLVMICASTAALHAVVYKLEPRAAMGWFAFIFASPIVGTILYFYFGINRIERKAYRLKSMRARKKKDALNSAFLNLSHKLAGIQHTGESLSYSPTCRCIDVLPLNTGDEAYPEMLRAIKSAKESITLFSYIFHYDPVGMKFVNELAAAQDRGVQVRVMVDGVGSQKTLKKMYKEFHSRGIPFQVFLPVMWRSRFANLRNHRKLLIVDGNIAFTGGLNISEIYWPAVSEHEKVLDFHFRLEGEIVYYLQAAFAEDWYFVGGEELQGKPWFLTDYPSFDNENVCRVVVDGPGDWQRKMRMHFISAINSAEKTICIATPYFLPDSGVSSALISAVLRGVEVDVLIPRDSDHKLTGWALYGSVWELLAYGCRIWQSLPPFDHSKLFVVDNEYVSIGSSNWDPRSLRLNFEMNVEFYSPKLAEQLMAVFNHKKSLAKQYTLADLEKRPFWVKVRHGFARMFSPYL